MAGFVANSFSLDLSFRSGFVRIVWMMPFRSFLLRHPWDQGDRVLVASGVMVEQNETLAS